MTHEDQQRAYNAGWNCGRWPDDPRYQGCEPTNPDLWEHYEDGKADGYVERRRNERGGSDYGEGKAPQGAQAGKL